MMRKAADLRLLTRLKLISIVLELDEELELADKTISGHKAERARLQGIHTKELEAAVNAQRKAHGDALANMTTELEIVRAAKTRAETKVMNQAREIASLKREIQRLDNIAARVIAKEVKLEFAPTKKEKVSA